jgi:NitT/TauT family transport system permease protein
MKTKKTTIRILKFILICVLWIAVWGVISKIVDKELLLPSPISVGKRLLELAKQKNFYLASYFSLIRVFLGIVVSMVTALLTAYLTSKIKLLHDIFTPLLTVIKATPVASFILLAFLWIDKEILPAFISFLIIFPIIWSNTEMGILNIDKHHVELAQVFNLPPILKLRRIYIPSVMPYFISAMRTSIGLAFKAAIAAEVIFPSIRSIGKALNDSKMYLEITDLFAWTAVVIFLSFVMEYLFGFLLKRLGEHYNVKGGLA